LGCFGRRCITASRCSQVVVIRAEIEVDRNPPRFVTRKRTKKTTVAVRRLCPNLGADGALQAPSALPTQITFGSAISGIHRYIWRVNWFPREPEGILGKPLAIAIGSHPSRTDCNWVLRLKGSANCKNGKSYPVMVEYRGDSTWDSDDFRLDILASDAILSSPTFTARKHPSSLTNPEHDWLWVLQEIARGKNSAKLTRKLTSRRADSTNSTYHPQRTVDVTSARLWLIQSVPIDGLVTPRRLEISFYSAALVRGKPTGYARAVKALFRIQFCGAGKNGASHRENCDTPPLGGNCRETCECSRGKVLVSDRYRVLGFREETHVYLRKRGCREGCDGAAR
jgi:hypothetical protein